jgi:phospholipid/cholesterol/gamma-HCH transport system permease protein
MEQHQSEPACVRFRREATVLVLEFSGVWLISGERPDGVALLQTALAAEDGEGGCESLRFQVSELRAWDSALLLFIRQVCQCAERGGMGCDLSGLPVGVQNMMRMASSGSGAQMSLEKPQSADLFTRLGRSAIEEKRRAGLFFEFMGQLLIDGWAMLRGRVQFRWKDLLLLLQSTGPQALGIVCLLSFLTGLIIAFIGVIQLQKFAADIYVADLVGLAMARELGAVMVGVIMAGRTGAAFAAQIGSMQVNEEVDALVSFGISPMRFLVLPRVLALVLMMPLLCVCADLVGMLGGMLVAVMISEVSVVQYLNQLKYAVSLSDFFGGVFKSGVFGLIIALAGCYRGLNCGRDTSSVGLAATSAVVTGITGIVVADAIFAVLFNIWGI